MGLKPNEFWALSFPEWRALADARFGAASTPLARADLNSLMRLYPDT